MKRQWLQIVGTAIGGNLPVVATAYFMWNLPVKHYKHGGYGYLGHGIGLGWLAVALLGTWLTFIWSRDKRFRAIVKWEKENAAKYKAMILDKIPQGSQQERLMWKVMKELS